MKKIKLLVLLALPFASISFAQQKPTSTEKPLLQIIDTALTKAVAQYKFLGTQISGDQFPKSYSPLTKKFDASNSSWWCSGFYPGSLLYLYEYSKDPALLNEAERIEKPLTKEQFNKGTHDLGFMMFCSFGNQNRLKPAKENEDILLNSAKSLSTRFNKTAGVIKSWDHGAWKYPVIIDNMMNLEMLNWVTQHGGDPKFQQIAVTHSNTSMKEFYRPDYSSFHVVDFDETTGKVLRKTTHQGAANTSAWSRGQAWGLYGFITMYRDTKNEAYLTLAKNIAEFYLNHPNLPSDFVPYWDFDAGQQPLAYRDASAAAITASALMELGQFTKGEQKEKYINASVKMLESLSNDTYRAKYGENGGFLIKHCVGALTLNSEIDVPLVYADYYFLEALKRYKDWYLK